MDDEKEIRDFLRQIEPAGLMGTAAVLRDYCGRLLDIIDAERKCCALFSNELFDAIDASPLSRTDEKPLKLLIWEHQHSMPKPTP